MKRIAAASLSLVALLGCSRGEEWAPDSLRGRTQITHIEKATGILEDYAGATIVTIYAANTYQSLNPDGVVFRSGNYTYEKISNKVAEVTYQSTQSAVPSTWRDQLRFNGVMSGYMTGDQTIGGSDHFEGSFTLQ